MNSSPLTILFVFDALARSTQHCATLILGVTNGVPVSRGSTDLSRRAENSWPFLRKGQ